MSLDDCIITCLCLLDEMLPCLTGGKRVRERGPKPALSDSEIITLEMVGSSLGESQDKALFAYFRRHGSHFFPALRQVRCTCAGYVGHLFTQSEACASTTSLASHIAFKRDTPVKIIENRQVDTQ
jgi:hypothetical protein